MSLVLEIGVVGHPGIDYFTIEVCSLSWLQRQTFPLLAQYLVVMDSFNAQELEEFLTNTIVNYSAETSSELMIMLSRFANWEYTGM